MEPKLKFDLKAADYENCCETNRSEPATNSGIAVIGILKAMKDPIDPPTIKNKNTYTNPTENYQLTKMLQE